MNSQAVWVRQVSKGVLLAIGLSLVAIICLALITMFWGLSDTVLLTVNQLVKFGSIFFGAIAAVGRGGEKGFLKGGLVGLAYMAVGMGLYALLTRTGTTLLLVASDLGLGAGIGAVAGAIAANLRKNKQ